MTVLASLWLPILLSAVIVFVASSIIHMVTPWHKGEYPRLPDEDRFRAAVGPLGLPPGDYMVPRAASREDMKSAAFAEKMMQGPNVVMTVHPTGAWSMGRTLALWFLYLLVVTIFAAYVAGRALPPGTEYMQVFRFVGTVAFVGYAVALWQMSIWYRRSWTITMKATVDGLVYGLLTAGVFGWLWPM
jgi:hypothetical protein